MPRPCGVLGLGLGLMPRPCGVSKLGFPTPLHRSSTTHLGPEGLLQRVAHPRDEHLGVGARMGARVGAGGSEAACGHEGGGEVGLLPLGEVEELQAALHLGEGEGLG